MGISRNDYWVLAVLMTASLVVLTSRGFAVDIFEDPALIAHWTLDEGSGQIASDSSSNGLDLQLGNSSGVDGNDPSWGERGVEFQEGNYITSVVDEDLLDFDCEDPFTVSLWVKRPQGAPAGHVVCKALNSDPYRGWYVSVRANNTNAEFMIRESTWERLWVQTNTPASELAETLKDWTHIAVSYDGSTDASGVAFYINGLPAPAKVASDGLDPGETTVNDVPICMGAREEVGTYMGGLDDVAIWGRVLTADEVREASGISWAPGDANRDGKVDEADAAVLAANWLRSPDATWSDGDFNNDGVVNDVDATLLATNWQRGVASGSVSVPEPGIFAFLLGGVLGIVICPRRYWI